MRPVMGTSKPLRGWQQPAHLYTTCCTMLERGFWPRRMAIRSRSTCRPSTLRLMSPASPSSSPAGLPAGKQHCTLQTLQQTALQPAHCLCVGRSQQWIAAGPAPLLCPLSPELPLAVARVVVREALLPLDEGPLAGAPCVRDAAEPLGVGPCAGAAGPSRLPHSRLALPPCRCDCPSWGFAKG